MDADTILRAEWSKSRARALRAREEVLLLKEEMRRVLLYLEWRAKKWASDARLRDLLVDSALREGLNAYASQRAIHQQALATQFKGLWQTPLKQFIQSEATFSPDGTLLEALHGGIDIENPGEDVDDWEEEDEEDKGQGPP
ncbi:hypothetical protein BJ165DRAFT_1518939 [Panaeolus papilionaceus]|nr:hypothetical protein BJ165DRAFT_1518939 [Panaeolus papilionaceus]